MLATVEGVGYLYIVIGRFLFEDSCGIMYESNSSFVSSQYSYLQYRWSPKDGTH